MAKREGVFTKLVRQHADPANFTLHVIGVTLGFWGIWVRNWVAVFVGFFIWPLIGTIYAWFGRARIESWMLNHYVNVTNMILHLVGFALIIYAFYLHDFTLAFWGLALSMVGHVYVWWQK
jgi:hypothetical protein